MIHSPTPQHHNTIVLHTTLPPYSCTVLVCLTPQRPSATSYDTTVRVCLTPQHHCTAPPPCACTYAVHNATVIMCRCYASYRARLERQRVKHLSDSIHVVSRLEGFPFTKFRIDVKFFSWPVLVCWVCARARVCVWCVGKTVLRRLQCARSPLYATALREMFCRNSGCT